MVGHGNGNIVALGFQEIGPLSCNKCVLNLRPLFRPLFHDLQEMNYGGFAPGGRARNENHPRKRCRGRFLEAVRIQR